jgi:hypothetical protein
MAVQTLDYSLTALKVPGLASYTPPFGTKKADGSGLTTAEINRNVMLPFMKQRSISGVPAITDADPPMGIISTDSIATPIEFDANFAVAAGVHLQLADPSYEGQVIRVVAAFESGNPAAITLGVAGSPDVINIQGKDVLLLFAVGGKWQRFVSGGSGESVGGSKTPRERYLLYATTNTLKIEEGIPIRYWDEYTQSFKFYTAPAGGQTINVATSLDTGSIQNGKDYYLYICPQQDGALQFKTSLNSTYPTGVASALYATQIGGFHTLCVAVEAKTTKMYIHPFSSLAAGSIHKNSIWDLYHRSSATQEGFYYSPSIKKWVSIYLMSSWGTFPASAQGDSFPPQNGGLKSIFGGTIADGASTPKWHGDKFAQFLAMQGMRLPRFDEFTLIAMGSPEGANIQGTADPVTTGGHSATSGGRIISYEGAEDAVGVLWQWMQETYGPQSGSYTNRFDENDIDVGGQMYGTFYRLIAGGGWGNGAACGSRGSPWAASVLFLSSGLGCRAVAEPLN